MHDWRTGLRGPPKFVNPGASSCVERVSSAYERGSVT